MTSSVSLKSKFPLFGLDEIGEQNTDVKRKQSQ